MCVPLLESGRFGILEDSFFLYSLFSLEKQPDYDCRQLYLNTLTISLSPPTS